MQPVLSPLSPSLYPFRLLSVEAEEICTEDSGHYEEENNGKEYCKQEYWKNYGKDYIKKDCHKQDIK